MRLGIVSLYSDIPLPCFKYKHNIFSVYFIMVTWSEICQKQESICLSFLEICLENFCEKQNLAYLKSEISSLNKTLSVCCMKFSITFSISPVKTWHHVTHVKGLDLLPHVLFVSLINRF